VTREREPDKMDRMQKEKFFTKCQPTSPSRHPPAGTTRDPDMTRSK